MMVVKEPSPLYFNLKEARHLSEICSCAEHFSFWKTNQFHVGELHFGLGLVVSGQIEEGARFFSVVLLGLMKEIKGWRDTSYHCSQQLPRMFRKMERTGKQRKRLCEHILLILEAKQRKSTCQNIQQ